MATLSPLEVEWHGTLSIKQFSYTCGFCGDIVGANQGYVVKGASGSGDGGRSHYTPVIIICPSCNRPTFFSEYGWQTQSPAPMMGRDVKHLPKDVERLYNEARSCTKVGAYTSCVLDCRKLLMHIAVEKSAPLKQTFNQYVEYLASNNWIPQNAKVWVEHIKDKGNEANHKIVYASADEASEILRVVEMLLTFVYEYADPPTSTKAASTP